MKKTTLSLIIFCVLFCIMPGPYGCGGGDDGTNGNGNGTPEPLEITALKIVLLDGTEKELSDKPLPLMLGVKATLSAAITEEADRQAIEGLVGLAHENGAEVEGAFGWSSDFTELTFTPNRKLEYNTRYDVEIDEENLPELSLSKAVADLTTSFTTAVLRDVNGDGYADAIVGAYRPACDCPGRTYIFYGSSSGIANGAAASVILTGLSANDYFGGSVSTGDFNADGYADLVIGAGGDSVSYDMSGHAYVFLGSASMQNCDLSNGCPSYATISGVADYEFLGSSVSGICDVNGDGYDDIITGALGANGAGTSRGQAYIFYGGPTLAGSHLPTEADVIIEGNSDGALVGHPVSGAGDIDGDGFCDIIISQDLFSGGRKAFIFRGGSSLSSKMFTTGAYAVISGDNDGDRMGSSVGTAGDVNGDGFDDILVGAEGVDEGATQDVGEAYLFLGGGTLQGNLGTSNASARLTGAVGEDSMGSSVGTAGDINGDGYDDITIGANGDQLLSHAYVIHGANTASGLLNCDQTACTPQTTITGETNQDYMGQSASTMGDVNGDELYDIIIGAPFWEDDVERKGAAYLFYGSTSGIADCNMNDASPCTPDVKLVGEQHPDRFGVVN